jgi:hypothetical protein
MGAIVNPRIARRTRPTRLSRPHNALANGRVPAPDHRLLKRGRTRFQIALTPAVLTDQTLRSHLLDRDPRHKPTLADLRLRSHRPFGRERGRLPTKTSTDPAAERLNPGEDAMPTTTPNTSPRLVEDPPHNHGLPLVDLEAAEDVLLAAVPRRRSRRAHVVIARPEEVRWVVCGGCVAW